MVGKECIRAVTGAGVWRLLSAAQCKTIEHVVHIIAVSFTHTHLV